LIKTAAGLGTGFYVTPDLILTAYHVVEKTSLVEISFYGGKKTFGKVIDHDVRLDLALVRPQMTGNPVKIHSGPVRLGSTVEAIGHPKGLEFTITRGVISALRKQKGLLGSAMEVEFVQTDTPISPGNSGGPLFLGDAVIGVNDYILVDKALQNLNFSVSFNEIKAYLDRFHGGGR
jgi:serine protease Do